MNIRLVTGSGSDLQTPYPSWITVLPLTITFRAESFRDGVDLDHHRFYERLIEGDSLPTTSQISPAAFGDVFRAAAWISPGPTGWDTRGTDCCKNMCRTAPSFGKDIPTSCR